jgi:hypothetical protein
VRRSTPIAAAALMIVAPPASRATSRSASSGVSFDGRPRILFAAIGWDLRGFLVANCPRVRARCGLVILPPPAWESARHGAQGIDWQQPRRWHGQVAGPQAP